VTTAYFDCFSGISGDMILGALVDLGADFDHLCESLGTLPVSSFRLVRNDVRRCGIGATKIDVVIEGETDRASGRGSREAHHAQNPYHSDPKAHSHKHEHSHGHRSYAEIESILEGSGLSPFVKEKAAHAYRLIAEAESRVHRQPVDNIHFHEVGSIDAIVDVVGAFVGLELLGVEEVWASELTTGFGTVKTDHGLMPVPAPATVEILKGVPLRRGTIESELVTPTGAAILRAACERFGSWPDGFHAEKTGYGAGTKEFPGHMNCLRVFLGHRRFAGGHDKPESPRSPSARSAGVEGESTAASAPPGFHAQVLSVVQTEIDDMSGEVYTHLMNRLFEIGSHDVTLTPIQMKKNRPGVRVEVLCGPDKREAVASLLLRETTTFGVKIREVERVCLDRRFETVQTPYGPVRMKVGLWNGEVLKAAPEYEDCHQLAIEHNSSLLAVMEAARDAFARRKR